MTWTVKAVNQSGVVAATLAEVNVGRVSRSRNGRETAELTIPTLSAAADYFAVNGSEIQLWLDGSIYFWGRVSRISAARQGDTDTMRVELVGLFSYLADVVIGPPKTNHITSPHLDAATIGSPPASWTKTANIEAAAVVDNNAEYWQDPVAIQVNNSEAGEDAYIAQQFTVPAALDGVPLAASARVYVADNQGGAPAWGGPAYQQRGLFIMRLDSGGSPLAAPKAAQITEDTPRNEVVRLQTDEIICATGDKVEVRLYSPDAWVVWRHAGVFDGRALQVDEVDRTAAIVALVEHAQDTGAGKQDHLILTSATATGETVSRSWPWYQRFRVSEQIEDLLDGVEVDMTITATTRTLTIKGTIGTTVAALTKTDLLGWTLNADLATFHTSVYRLGDGSGPARDEFWDAVGGVTVRDALTFAAPGETLGLLRDRTAEDLARFSSLDPTGTITFGGTLAKTIRPGDTIPLTLAHGWAQVADNVRAMTVELTGTPVVATVTFEVAR